LTQKTSFFAQKMQPIPQFSNLQIPKFSNLLAQILCASAPLRETILHISISHSKSPILKSRSALRSIRVIRVPICIVGKTVTWIDVCSIRELPRMMLYIQCYFKIFFHRLTQKTRFFAQKMYTIPQFSNFQIFKSSNLLAQILCASTPLRETILHITISHSKSTILKSRSALRSIRVIRVAICIVGKKI